MNFFTIETERLLLKKLSPQDFNYLFQNHSKTTIKKILGYDTDEEYKTEKNKFIKGYSSYSHSFVFFQLYHKAQQCIIGGCGFHNWAVTHRRAELGYSLKNDDFKKQGYMSEALPPIINYGFTQMKLYRMEALISPDNTPSLKLIKKFGFIKEGLLRKHYFTNETFEDSIIFSRLVTDQ